MAAEKLRVLVVDDSQSMRAAAKAVLSNECEVLGCEDGLEALAVLASFQPAIIFVDIVMPKLDGYETVALIRSSEAFSEVPIVMMSSKGGVFDVARGRLLGFNGFITKPFKSEALRASVAQHLGVQLAEAP